MSSGRERGTRRTMAVALGLSAAVHAAAFAWLAFPIQPLEKGPRLTHDKGSAPDVKLVVLREESVAPVVVTDAAAGPAGGAGTPSRAAAPLRSPPAAASPVSARGESPLVLAAADTLRRSDVAPIPAATVTPVAVAGPVAAEAGATQPAPVHVPGSAASAKGRGAGSSQGSGGVGVSVGHGGIGIKIGGGRKRHPPRGMPGRGRW
jgi:hypothetical protein